MVTLFTTIFNIQNYEIMPTECISLIVIDLSIIGDYLPKHNKLLSFTTERGVFTARYELNL